MVFSATGFNSIRRLVPTPIGGSTLSTRRIVSQIIARQKKLHSLSESQLRKQSLSLKYEAQSGRTLSSLLPDAYALVRESARRTVSMEHFPVQIFGGISIHRKSIAVMQTGEGKTLTATMPLYLASLTGKGAHLVTANDYLAARDADITRPIFDLLGVSVGVVVSDTQRKQRSESYACDVMYSTAKEIGFDFLRDRLLSRSVLSSGVPINLNESNTHRESSTYDASKPVQRELNFVLVDEADSILIDEARTPLVVSSAPDSIAIARAALYQWAADNADKFEAETHYELDPQSNQIELTAHGRRFVRKIEHPESISEMPLLDIYDFVEQAILVAQRFQKDRHYVIREDEVVIVDEFTGRLAEGRKWRAGLHQAIEAREKLEVSFEAGEAARITIQDLFLRYDRLGGMTGTVANSGRELNKIYGVDVVHVPTNRPPKRKQWKDNVFGTEADKWKAVAQEVQTIQAESRPVLIGTRSIDKSMIVSKLLTELGIEHEVLNASNIEREAEIVSHAGQPGKVTVATNMAGRGTDIKLSEEAVEAGGMHVICTELHESARIDRQLIGRCGRQGDPGSFRQFMSLDDDIILTAFGESFAKRLKRNSKQSLKNLARFAKLFRQAQSNIEQRHFKARKTLLHFERKRHQMQKELGQDPFLDTPG